jgi:N-acyl-D-amino-acid deacylase
VEQYLDMFTQKVAVNVAYVVGNSPLRICAMGWDNTPATSAQIANQRALLRTGMEEGAFGVSTGLDYPPGSYADTAELIELSKEAQRLGGIYHTHVRYSLGDRFLDPFREALDIGRGSGIPIHITHFYHRTTSPGGAARMLDLVEDARDEGLDVTFDSYPYPLSSTRLTIMVPQWAHDGGVERLKVALATERDRLRTDMQPRAGTWDDMWLTHFKHQANHRFEGRSIAQVADMMDKDPVDAICDLLIAEDLQVSYVSAGGNASTLPKFVSHPLSMVGSDALLIGDYPSPRTYGTFPIILAEFVREERFMALPDAIRKMTSFPAQRLGIPDRGIVRDGFKADLVVFDPQRVKAPATRKQPKQFPIGIDWVVVNGKVVVDQGAHTGVLAGRALRRGKP